MCLKMFEENKEEENWLYILGKFLPFLSYLAVLPSHIWQNSQIGRCLKTHVFSLPYT